MTITTYSMMNCVSSPRVLRTAIVTLCAAAAALLGGCTTEVDPTLGYDIVPENRRMVMRHLTFKGGKMIRFDRDASTDAESKYEEVPAPSGNFFETSLYRTDRHIASNLDYGYMGVERNDSLGVRSAGFATSMSFMNYPDPEEGFGYKPVFDSMCLLLDVQVHGADSLVPVKYEVFELTKPLFGNVVTLNEAGTDSVATLRDVRNRMDGVYDKNTPLFTFTFPDPDNGIEPQALFVKMNPVDLSKDGATWDFVRRMMLVPDNTDEASWDGYARDKEGVYKSDAAWAKHFNGIYIRPVVDEAVENRRGTVFGTKLSMSGLFMQVRNRNPKDPTLIRDTLGMYYYFHHDTVTVTNMSVNLIEHDFSRGLTSAPSLLDGVCMNAFDENGNAVPREQRTKVGNCFVDGMAGPVTELHFTDDFLDNLCNAVLEPDENGDTFSTVAVNQCLMYLYFQGADYDWSQNQANAAKLTPLMNDAMGRVGIYTDYNTFRNIVDYDYVYETNYSTSLAYGGNVNRSRACYVMNISGYMQQLYNYARSVYDAEQDKYLFNEADEKYVPRTVYIAPEAASPYTLARSAVQGMEGSATAPIHMELTYTLIK